MKGSVYPYNLPSGAKRWRAQIPLPSGKRLTKSGFKLKGVAEQWMAERRGRSRKWGGSWSRLRCRR